MQSYLVKLIYIAIIVTPFLTPVRLDLGWPNLSPENMKTAWGVVSTTMLFTVWLIAQYRGSEFRVVRTKLYLPIFGFVFWSFITLLWVEDGYSASIMLAQFVSYALIFFIIINVFEERRVPSVMRVLVAVMSVVSFLGLLQYYFSDVYIIKNLVSQTASPGSTFANKNMASHFIVMTLPLSFVLLLSARNKFNISLYSVTSLIGSWFLIYTFARQAYVAMVVELLIFLLVLALDNWKNKDRSLLKTAVHKKGKGVALIAILLFLSLAANFTDKGWESAEATKINKIQSIVETEGNPRLPAWRNTIEMIKDHPISGVGVAQWAAVYPRYYDRIMKDIIFNEDIRLRRLHNEYLEVLANFGLVGYVFLLWLLYLIVRRSLSVLLNSSNSSRGSMLAMVLGLTGFGVVSMFSFPIRVYLPAFLVFVYFALIYLSSTPNKKLFVVINLKGKILKLFLLLIFMSGSVFASKYAYNWLTAEHHSLYAKGFIDEASKPNPLLSKEKLYALASGAGLKALSYNKRESEYYSIVGSSLLLQNKPEDAIFFFKKAIDISPFNTGALLQLSLAYQMKPEPNLEMERKVLEFLLSFDPKNVKALALLVKNLATNNRGKDATIVYERLKRYFEYFKGRSGFGPYHSIVGITAVAVSDYKYAQYIYKDAIKQFPSSAENYYNLAVIESGYLKNYKEGAYLAKKALNLNPNMLNSDKAKILIDKYESINNQ